MIKWEFPGPDVPGYMRRRRELSALINAEDTPENLDALAQYLVQYVKGPVSHDEALAEILELPFSDYFEILARIVQGKG